MGRALRLATFALVLVGLAAPNLASADEGDEGDEGDEISAENKRRARQLYNLGKKLFAAKEFAEAAKTFAESFDFDPRPGALFNQGRCLEEHGNKPAAISAFKRYLVLQPAGGTADEARTRTLALERQLELEGKLDDGKTQPGKDDDVPDGGRSLRVAGLATGGAGIAIFATGAYFGLKARSISAELEDREGQWTDAELDRFDEGERAEKIGISLMTVGVAAAVGGGVLYYLGHRAKSDIEVAPVVTGDAAGASVTLRF